jgi:activator of HSP90 ATPase
MSFSFIVCIISAQPSLFSQVKPGTASDSAYEQGLHNNIVIHQQADFKVAPEQVYQALLDSKKFSACIKKSFANFSDTSARIDPSVGGSFSVFDGHIIGRILELVPNQRIVQAWRVVDWPAGVYSIAKFEVAPQGSGTHLTFDHIGFPPGLKEHLAEGWQLHYWDALTAYFQ